MRKQLNLNLYQGTWGGRRPKSGRKRIHSQGVAHRTREEVNHRLPLHVNFKYRIGIRNKEMLRILKRAILNSRKKGLKIIHYSMQSNHIHLVLEATDNMTLSSGMRSLTVTMARGMNKGKVQIERYHLHVLRTFQEAKNANKYVLLNEQKHSGKKVVKLDPYSSLHQMDAKRLARKERLVLVFKAIERMINLDTGQSYLTKAATAQLLG